MSQLTVFAKKVTEHNLIVRHVPRASEIHEDWCIKNAHKREGETIHVYWIRNPRRYKGSSFFVDKHCFWENTNKEYYSCIPAEIRYRKYGYYYAFSTKLII